MGQTKSRLHLEKKLLEGQEKDGILLIVQYRRLTVDSSMSENVLKWREYETDSINIELQ